MEVALYLMYGIILLVVEIETAEKSLIAPEFDNHFIFFVVNLAKEWVVALFLFQHPAFFQMRHNFVTICSIVSILPSRAIGKWENTNPFGSDKNHHSFYFESSVMSKQILILKEILYLI